MTFHNDNTKKPCFVIAEAGVNHNGSIELAMKLVDAAVSAKADAVKFQTFKAERLVTKGVEKAKYQKKNEGGRGVQYDMLKRLELPFGDFRKLKLYCDKRHIQFMSTPFDEESAAFLVEDLGMSLIKIPSGEVTTLPFLRRLAGFNKPIVLSTGMCDLKEVRTAIDAIHETGFKNTLTLLHCTTEYPCPYEDVNLRAMVTLKEHFNLPVGYSDHTIGFEVAIAAVALGAVVIEKHFTLDRAMQGPDHKCSLEPEELKKMIEVIRNIEKSLGNGEKRPTLSEMGMRKLVRKTLVAALPLAAGSELARDSVIAKRAGGDISPADIDKLIGMKLRVDKNSDEAIYWQDVEGEWNNEQRFE